MNDITDNSKTSFFSDKVEIRIAFSIAFSFLVAVLFVGIFLYVNHLSELTNQNLPMEETYKPKYNQLTLNEWGDFFAGLGASLALVFISLGLFLQMKELSAQREEMKEAREEQSLQTQEMGAARVEQREATRQILNTRIDENLRVLFEICNDQIKIQPALNITLTRSEDDLYDGNDKLCLTIVNRINHEAQLSKITIFFPEHDGYIKYLNDALSKNSEEKVTYILDFQHGLIADFLNINLRIKINYLDMLGYSREIEFMFEREKQTNFEPDLHLVELTGERTMLAEKITSRNNDLLGKST